MSMGHAAHSHPASAQQGLSGQPGGSVTVCIVGAGSMFCPTLCRDLLLVPGLDRGELRLCDIDESRLATMATLIRRLLVQTSRAEGWTVRASPRRDELLPGSNYVICCIEVAGEACVGIENDIPARWGVDQCIGDTVGPGGLMKGLRTAPVYLELLRDIHEHCPEAILLNYTNPMSLLILAGARAVPQVRAVGLCHSVQGTSQLLAHYAGVPYEEMEWQCAGINHLAWFTTLRHHGRDLYKTVLLERFAREVAEGIRQAEAGQGVHDSLDERPNERERADLVRKDMCLHFGAFITESSGHLSEYLPYYRKSAEGRKLLRRGYDGGSRFYATNWPAWKRRADEQRERLIRGEQEMELVRSWEYASWIIEAMEKDAPLRIHGNVYNRDGSGGSLITNLPDDGAVEVACLVDRAGIHPTRFGKLPSHMAHICRDNMAFFDLAADAVIERSLDLAELALQLDPLTRAVCTPAQIRALARELFAAEADFLPGYR
jgi:alpha-galactosidase